MTSERAAALEEALAILTPNWDINIQIFRVNGDLLKDGDGNHEFFARPDIERAVNERMDAIRALIPATQPEPGDEWRQREAVRALEADEHSKRAFILETERDALAAQVARLLDHIAEQVHHLGNRIKDGKELGPAVWRIALEDAVREGHAALQEVDHGKR